MIPFVDAHAHGKAEEEREFRKNIVTLWCGTDPEEAERLLNTVSGEDRVCCAMHPWKADPEGLSAMEAWMDRCSVVGEIGLDSVWTDRDPEIQRQVFHRQLEYARKKGKPVVLHTKGMEREIAETLKPYPLRKLIHWYSGDEGLEELIRRDCYFTVGPDYERNPAVQRVLRQVPTDRLLTETDGMDAVEWALGRKVNPGEIEEIIAGEVRAVAAAKALSFEEAKTAIYHNFIRFTE